MGDLEFKLALIFLVLASMCWGALATAIILKGLS